MDRNDELGAAHERLRLTTESYAEMIAGDQDIPTEDE
jgi:hypothetical protein